MNFAANPYQSPSFTIAAQAAVDERAGFLTKTYLHLAGAVGLLVVLEAVLLSLPATERLVGMMVGGRFSWLIVLGLFMAVSAIAENWARSATSVQTQYAGLGLYVLAEAVILLPLIYIANQMDAQLVPTAAIATFGLFAR